MADLFHSLEKIDSTVCCGIFKKNIFFSIRAKNRDEAGINAEKIAVALGGGGGGHGRVGAGRIPFDKARESEILINLWQTFKAVFNISARRGRTYSGREKEIVIEPGRTTVRKGFPMWEYSDKVRDHFLNPRNAGEIENPDGIRRGG